MKYGIISDIHSNIEALEAVHAELIASGCEDIICLGDIVGYGASPNECIDFMQKNNIRAILGNHDSYVIQSRKEFGINSYAQDVVLWTRKKIGKQGMKYLKSLPESIEENDILFVHASAEKAKGDYWPYIIDIRTAIFHFYSQKTKFGFFGHTHVPLLFTQNLKKEIDLNLLHAQPLILNAPGEYLLNPGSVGQPRDSDPRASCVIFDSKTYEVLLKRVEYDVLSAQSKILAAGLPERLATRLIKGN